MDRVFPALERKFLGNRQLVRWARKLYHGHGGEAGKTLRAYVEVTCEGVNHDYDTFTSTEPVYSLTFTIRTKDHTGIRCSQIMGELRDTYKDCDLSSGDFETVRMLYRDASGPLMDAESVTYMATMTFELHISLKVQSPVEALT